MINQYFDDVNQFETMIFSCCIWFVQNLADKGRKKSAKVFPFHDCDPEKEFSYGQFGGY